MLHLGVKVIEINADNNTTLWLITLLFMFVAWIAFSSMYHRTLQSIVAASPDMDFTVTQFVQDQKLVVIGSEN